MSVVKEPYGIMPDGREVFEYTIENLNGVSISVITYGATLNHIMCPDRNGEYGDILAGFDSLEAHMANPGYYCGQTVGQYCNRLCGGSFKVGDIQYSVTLNENGKTCLHGGGEYSHALWRGIIADDNKVEFFYRSPDGAEGFPGNVEVYVTFTLTDDNVINIEYSAVSDRDTVINLTNHAYFNLGTVRSGDVLSHILTLDCDYFTPTDGDSIPTGEIRPVEGTAFDFRQGKPIGLDIGADDIQLTQCRGYDHNFCIKSEKGKIKHFAHVLDPESGRILDAYTDLPGVQLYTGNFMSPEDTGKDGIPFGKHYAFCLETQYYPDSPNHRNFPGCIFKAGEKYSSVTRYKISAEKNENAERDS